MGKIKDIAGHKYNRLTVIEFAGLDRYSKAQWICKCDCGNLTVVNGSRITSGLTKSCGCLQKEIAHNRELRRNQIKYSCRPARLYSVWNNMKQRCTNPDNPAYLRYGAQGIELYADWMDFEKFMEWAYSSGYDDSLTIDRIDNDKGYYPENCRWVDKIIQGQNRRNVILVEYRGEVQPLSKLAREHGIKPHTARGRYYQGWSIDKILETPLNEDHIRGNQYS